MEEFEEEALESLKADQGNFNRALDALIDSVSHFKAAGGDDLTEIKPEDWGQMLNTLDFARFIVSGLMYGYGISLCGHDHSEDEDDK